MRAIQLLVITFVWLTLAGLTGCHRCHTVWNNVARTVCREPKCFDYCDRSEYYRELACQYLANVGNAGDEHFRSGFIDGFADYIHRGGNGQSPVLPPRRYWEPIANNWRANAIDQWKTGFEAGAQIAIESGLRQQIIIPEDRLAHNSPSIIDAHRAAPTDSVLLENNSFETHSEAAEVHVEDSNDGTISASYYDGP